MALCWLTLLVLRGSVAASLPRGVPHPESRGLHLKHPGPWAAPNSTAPNSWLTGLSPAFPGSREAEALLGPWGCAGHSRPSRNVSRLHVLCPWPRPSALRASVL